MNEATKAALESERSWRNHLSRLDTGSYCENPEPAAVSASKIMGLYRQLADELLDAERNGYKFPVHEI